ncbi:MAG: hypothetical protein U9P49_03045 [Thermodesulfobacteriota bacterium]|nr:hypothetical protein [Thermodesulfobacteriota bacterium]
MFVSKWLNVLFFEAFNKRYSHPEWMPKEFHSILQMAPYLNGGLFKQNGLDNRHSVLISDKDFEEAFNFYQRYNFTITENTPVDQEVAVDPEMIGNVYESLVNISEEVDTQGEAGIFYTPRTEIALMCRLAMVDRLTKKLGQDTRNKLYEMVFAFEDDDKEAADTVIAKASLWPKSAYNCYYVVSSPNHLRINEYSV